MRETVDVDDLTTQQLTELKQSLQSLKEELTAMLSDCLDSSRPVGLDQPIGRLSRMDALQQQSMTQASRRAAQLRLDRVNQALGRISREDYGYCLECEEEIDHPRLQAQPESPFCIDCQSRREKP